MKPRTCIWITSALLAVANYSLAVSASAAEIKQSANQDHARQQLAGLSELPKFVAAGPAFSARKVMAGKSIWCIPGASNNPWYDHALAGMKDAATAVGYPFSFWSNQGLLSQYQQGLARALTTKPTLVDLFAGPDPHALKPEIDAAVAAGIQVAVSHNYALGVPVPNVEFNLPVDFARAARLLADWVITKDTQAHVLVIVSDELPSTASMREAIADEFKQYGGGGIQCVFKNVPIPEWGTGIKPAVAAAIAADPKLTYVICIYDSMAKFVVPAIADAKADGRVKIIGFNGTPFVLDFIREGKVEMALGESLAWAGYAIADADMRIIGGQGAVKSMNIPFRIFTKENAAEAGVPASFDKGYGDTFKSEYAKLWELEEPAVRAAAEQFYAALNQLFTGEMKPMTEIWSHANDVTYMGPIGGFQVGWDAVRKDWESQAAMKLGGKLEATEMQITAGTDLAVVSNYEQGENTNAKGEVQKVAIRATNIFRKEGGQWKMIGHHVDLLPQMAK